MLQTMRNPKVLKWGLWTILLVTIPSFVTFYGFGDSGGHDVQTLTELATVKTSSGKKIVGKEEVREAEQQVAGYYAYLAARQLIGPQFADRYAGQLQGSVRGALTNRQKLDWAVSAVALEEVADEQGILVSDAQISRILTEQGVTDEQLKAFLQNESKSMDEFVLERRQMITRQRAMEFISSISRVSLLEAWNEYRYEKDLFDAEYVRIPVADQEKNLTVSEEEIAKHFQDNGAAYQKAEERIYRYILWVPPVVESDTEVTEEQVRAEYAKAVENKDSRVTQEAGLELRHIQFRVDDNESTDSVRSIAEQILDKARTGTDFLALANDYTEDLQNITYTTTNSTSKMGGRIETRLNASTAPALASMYGQEWVDAATKLTPGQISDLVASGDSLHILRAENSFGETKSFEEARASLEALIRSTRAVEAADKRKKVVDENERKLREIADKNTSIEGIARELNLQVMETSTTLASATSIPPIGDLSQSREALRDLRPGEISPVLRAARLDNLAIVQVKEVIPARPNTLEEVRTRVEADARNAKANEAAASLAAKIVERVKGGDALASATLALASDLRAEFVKEPFTVAELPEGLREGGDELRRQLFRHGAGYVFTVPGGAAKPTEHLVVAIRSKQEPDRAKFLADLKDYETAISEAKSASFLAEFRKAAHDRLNASYNKDFIAADESRAQRNRNRRRE